MLAVPASDRFWMRLRRTSLGAGASEVSGGGVEATVEGRPGGYLAAYAGLVLGFVAGLVPWTVLYAVLLVPMLLNPALADHGGGLIVFAMVVAGAVLSGVCVFAPMGAAWLLRRRRYVDADRSATLMIAFLVAGVVLLAISTHEAGEPTTVVDVIAGVVGLPLLLGGPALARWWVSRCAAGSPGGATPSTGGATASG